MKSPKILDLADIASITEFEKSLLKEAIPDDMERELKSWHASWRKESLEHYLPLGWSFGIWQDGQLVGYFIGQPQLFARALTQTLWVERLQSISPEVTAELIDLAYKVCREKHFQKILFFVDESTHLVNNSVFQLQRVEETIWELKTSKI